MIEPVQQHERAGDHLLFLTNGPPDSPQFVTVRAVPCQNLLDGGGHELAAMTLAAVGWVNGQVEDLRDTDGGVSGVPAAHGDLSRPFAEPDDLHDRGGGFAT